MKTFSDDSKDGTVKRGSPESMGNSQIIDSKGGEWGTVFLSSSFQISAMSFYIRFGKL